MYSVNYSSNITLEEVIPRIALGNALNHLPIKTAIMISAL